MHTRRTHVVAHGPLETGPCITNCVVAFLIPMNRTQYTCLSSHALGQISAGTLDFSGIASDIAQAKVSAASGEKWDPPLGEGPGEGGQSSTSHEKTGRSKRKGDGDGPPLEPPNRRRVSGSRTSLGGRTNNFSKEGFKKLPPENEDFEGWTVAQLREFLSVSQRCAHHIYRGSIN